MLRSFFCHVGPASMARQVGLHVATALGEANLESSSEVVQAALPLKSKIAFRPTRRLLNLFLGQKAWKRRRRALG